MKLKFYSASKYQSKIKASIQRTGRLAFNVPAIQALGIEYGMRVLIGTEEGNDKPQDIYIQLLKGDAKLTNVKPFVLAKTGPHLYLNTTLLFHGLVFEFDKRTIHFNCVQQPEMSDPNGPIYKLERVR